MLSTQIKHIAELSRLAPSESELNKFSKQCGDIIEYINILAEVDTNDTEPLYSPLEHNEAVFRSDELRVEQPTRDQILANAPESDGSFFIVPKIV